MRYTSEKLSGFNAGRKSVASEEDYVSSRRRGGGSRRISRKVVEEKKICRRMAEVQKTVKEVQKGVQYCVVAGDRMGRESSSVL